MSKHKIKYILAIDLGTSGPKSALVSTGGEVLDSAFVENRLYLLPDGGAEQDPEEWWQSILDTVKILLSKKTVPAEDIIAVSCSTQWSGTVAVDKNGNHLTNALIWLDSRGSPYVREISDGLIKLEGYGISKIARWIRLTGGAPSHSGKDSIAHILYLKNQRPDIYHKTYKFLEPKDYINLRLTGKFAASFDSITLHWVTDNRDINHISYDDRLIRMATIDREKLPDLKQSTDILGVLKPEEAESLGLGPEVAVIMGTPDVQAAAVGSGGVADYDAHFYIGTSSWLTCHVPFKKTDIIRGIASLPSAIPGRYFVANEQETAGACLTFLRDNIFFHEDDLSVGQCPSNVYQIFDQMAQKIPAGSGGIIFTPWLYGERTPLDDKYVRGGFFNQSLETTREHMVRAVLEGVAFNGRWLLEEVE
jgi:xylulokinase